MVNRQLLAVFLLVFGLGLGYFVYFSETSSGFWSRPFRLGLDLQGGSHLVYEADTSSLTAGDVDEAMSALREVIERRVNAFGVAEPVIQVERTGLGAGGRDRLLVELPGVTDLNEALNLIRATPLLEFVLAAPETPAGFAPSGLTGRFLRRAEVNFSGQTLGPTISLEFNDEGAALLAEITKNNIGQALAIVLDGELLSAPIIQDEVTGGRAEITGQFTIEEARELVRNLNLGALPVPIALLSTQTIGATLGEDALNRGVRAGLFGLAVVALFMVIWYRLPGLVAMLALSVYILLMLAIFKLLPVTLTAPGIAGLVLSFGLALDANILIFERLKEELRAGRHIHEAIREGFARAWFSIRDANLSSLLAAIVLFWLGTSLIKGFALTLSLGIVVSMFTAISVSRTFLLALAPARGGRVAKFLFQCGFR